MRYVLYHAIWCPFCRAFAPKFREMVPDGEEVLLNDEMDPRWIELNISLIPTIIAFKGEREIRRVQARAHIGISEDMLAKFLE